MRPLAIEPEGNFRVMVDGYYEYRTVMPGIESLGIPEDGPLGRLYRALEQVDERPLHIHSIVTADKFHTLTTQSHFAGDPHVGQTSEPLSTPDSTVFDTELHDDPQDFKARDLDAPYYSMNIDYGMRPATA